MKRIATIATALFATAALFAQNNNLVVFSENGERFYLILNGLKQNDKPETNVKVTGLNAEWYTAKVIFDKTASGQLPDLNSKVGMMDGGSFVSNKEVTYSIKNKKGKYKLAWGGTADIPQQPVANPTQVVYTFNPSGNAVQQTTTTTTTGTGTGFGMSVNVSGMDGGAGTQQTTTTTTGGSTMTTTGGTTTTTTTTTTGGDNVNVGMNVGGVGVGISVSGTGMGGTTSTTTQQTTTTTTGGTTVVNTAPAGCMYPMGTSDFSSAKSSVQSKSFEDSKLTVAKQILNTNCMSSSQVKEIMQLFSFEETKLDWAKFAYGRTTDPNNYFKLNDAFTFETSIDELNKYIESHK